MVLELESWDLQVMALKAWWRVFSFWVFLGFVVLVSQNGEEEHRDLKIFIVALFIYFFFLYLSLSIQCGFALQLDNQKR